MYLRGLGATSDIQTLLNQAAAKYGIDPALAQAVARKESAFNQSAISPAGAIGVMQLMPDTAAGLGVNPYDTAQNIDGGVRYLSQLYAQFGNWTDALAAYNAGPGRVTRGTVPAPSWAYASDILASAGMTSGASSSWDTEPPSGDEGFFQVSTMPWDEPWFPWAVGFAIAGIVLWEVAS